MSFLVVKNLKKVYSSKFNDVVVNALNDVSFSVEEGEFVAIMGESGSGKTTLLNILSALKQISAKHFSILCIYGYVFVIIRNILSVIFCTVYFLPNV